MVEAARIELASENLFIQLSTSVVYHLNSLKKPLTNKLNQQVVRSHFTGTDTPIKRSPLINAQYTAAVLCK